MSDDSRERKRALRSEWDARVKCVTAAMRDYTQKFTTPISRVIDESSGELLGTGNYVQLQSHVLLLANEHVAKGIQAHSLGHQFQNCDSVFRVRQPFNTFPWPVDVGVTAIEPAVWMHSAHQSEPISEGQWALAHTPVDGEILFLKGFARERSRFVFGALASRATSYGCQEMNLPTEDERINARWHFALEYRPDLAQRVDKESRDLPVPDGFSGSLVWNTRYVELLGQNSDWTPADAQVTGLVWGWPSSNACLIASRVECVRSVLLRMAESFPKRE